MADVRQSHVEHAEALRSLVYLSIKRIEAHESVIASTLIDALRALPEELGLHSLSGILHATQLPDLSSETDPFLMQLGLSYPQLSWRAPGFGRLPAELTERMAVNELVGPTGQIAHETVRFGFLFQAAHISYPDHNHAAEELYLILKGAADWNVGGLPLGVQHAGQFVHHQPWQSHAMKTNNRPMLAMWGWVGDIGMKHYQLA